MKLVGATDWFIRWPFVIEGVLVGVLGGVLAVLLLGGHQGRAGRPAGVRLRADRRAGHDELRRCSSSCCSARASPCRRSARASRCAASCACSPGLPGADTASIPWCWLMRRSRRSLLPLLVILLPAMLVLGIWLGGHPAGLPEPVRDALVDETDGRVYEQAIDTLARDYYRKVDRKQLLDQSLEQAVRSLDDRFSNYFAPRDYADFQEATEGRFEGVGMTVDKVANGLKVITVYEGSPAARGGLEPGDVITHVDGRTIAGSSSEESTTKIKGPAGTAVRLTVRSPKGGPHVITLKRAQVDIPVVRSEMRQAGRAQDRLRAARELHLRRPRSGRRRGAQAAQGRRPGCRARPARQRRRPAQRGRDDLVDLHPGRQDRLHQGPLAADRTCTRRPAARSTPTSRSWCS